MRLQPNSKGYSLLEISIVLLLVAIALGLYAGNFSFLEHYHMRSQVETIKELINFCRQRAIVTGLNQAVLIHIDNSRLEYGNTNNRMNTLKLIHPISFVAPAQAKGPPHYPTRPVLSPITFPKKTITCHPDGSISAGTLYLGNHQLKHYFALSCGVAQIPFLRTYEYLHKKWVRT